LQASQPQSSPPRRTIQLTSEPYQPTLADESRLGQLFWAYERATGTGAWCAIIENTQFGCEAGYSEFAIGLQAGLEAGSNTPPDTLSNYGLAAGFFQATDGVDYPIFPAHADTPTPFPPGVAWCYRYPAPYENEIDFGTGYRPCPAGQKETENRAPGADLVEDSGAVGVSGVESPLTTPGEGNQPAAGYIAPTGPELSAASLQQIANAAISRNSSTAESATVYHMELQQALESTEPGYTVPTEQPTGLGNWLHSSVDVLVLRGKFTLLNASIPAGHLAPTGSVLDIIVDSHTGVMDGVRLSSDGTSITTTRTGAALPLSD
jgi:hypothetical protein